MPHIYSREKFEGYTHRFTIQFEIGKPYYSNIDIYSNSDSKSDLMNFINQVKSDKVLSFEVVGKASIEDDKNTANLIDSL